MCLCKYPKRFCNKQIKQKRANPSTLIILMHVWEKYFLLVFYFYCKDRHTGAITHSPQAMWCSDSRPSPSTRMQYARPRYRSASASFSIESANAFFSDRLGSLTTEHTYYENWYTDNRCPGHSFLLMLGLDICLRTEK